MRALLSAVAKKDGNYVGAELETGLEFVPPVGFVFRFNSRCRLKVERVFYNFPDSTIRIDFEEIGDPRLVENLIRDGSWEEVEVHA